MKKDPVFLTHSVDTIAVDCLVFEKTAFCVRVSGDSQPDRQANGQDHRVNKVYMHPITHFLTTYTKQVREKRPIHFHKFKAVIICTPKIDW